MHAIRRLPGVLSAAVPIVTPTRVVSADASVKRNDGTALQVFEMLRIDMYFERADARGTELNWPLD